jgi:hypothetical protein
MSSPYKVPAFGKTPAMRIKNENQYPGPLGSCRAQILIVCNTTAQITTYNSTHVGNEQNIVIPDAYKILPYTTLTLLFMSGPPADTDYRIGITPPAFGTNADVATATAAAVKAWVAARIKKYPDLNGLDANISPTGANVVLLQLPWGILGNPAAVYTGAVTGSITAGSKGVDNPLRAGIVGPRRNLYLFKGPYVDQYYGPIPVG